MIKTKSIGVCVGLLIPSALLFFFFFQNAEAISLEEAVLYSLKTNPEVKEKIENLNSVMTDTDIVKSGYYPKMYLSTGGGYAKEEIKPYYRPTGQEVWRNDTTLTATVNLFDGFYTTNDVRAQRYRVDSAKNYLKEYKGSIAMMTIESYISMIKQRALLKISDENVLAHREIYNRLHDKVRSGFGSVSDLEFGSGRLTLAEVNKIVIENNFMQSKVIFETIYGKNVDADKLQEPIFEYTLPKTLEDAAVIALETNPSIWVSMHNIESAKSNYQKNKSLYYPRVDFEIKRSWFDERNKYDYTMQSSQAMVYVTFNIFNGMADRATIQREKYTLNQTQEYLEYAKRDIAKRLGTSWIAVIKIKEQLKRLAEMKLYSKKTMDAYYEEFGVGKRTLLDLINVNNDYNNARQAYESAKYDLILSEFRILDAMGGMIEYFEAKADSVGLNLDVKPEDIRPAFEILKKMDIKLKSGEPFVAPEKGDKTYLEKLDLKDADKEIPQNEMYDELKLLQEAIDNE